MRVVKVWSQNPNEKRIKSGFEMTHGHVLNIPNTSLSFATHSEPKHICFLKTTKKQQKKNRNPEWEPPLNQREEPCKYTCMKLGKTMKKKIRQRRVKKRKGNEYEILTG